MSENIITQVLNKILKWFTDNSNTIFNFLGKLALLTILLFLVWRTIDEIIKFPGFAFDPVLILVLITAGIVQYGYNVKLENSNKSHNILLSEVLAELKIANQTKKTDRKPPATKTVLKK